MDYQQLNNAMDEIRLLTILQADDPSSVVKCELYTVSLNDYTAPYHSHLSALPTQTPPKTLAAWVESHPEPHPSINHNGPSKAARFNWGDFGALSYMWGDANDTRDVIINGRPLRVTSNLAAALQSFRLSGYFGPGGMKLWIDAICINQADVVERGLQVQQMGQIYSSAWTVVAWLGPEEDGSDQAVGLLESLAPYYGQESKTKELVDLLTKDPEYLGGHVWMPLHDFVERPYWSRLWILQEIVLAAADVVMICGGAKIMWSAMQHGIKMIDKGLYLIKNSLLDRERVQMGLEPMHTWDSLNLHHISRNIGGLTVYRQEEKSDLSIQELLQVADRAKATDPRDKVYGLLGLLSPKITERIVPNYNLKPGAVFMSAAKAFIEVEANLEILREGRLWGNFERPSWVPDWTAGFHSREAADLPRPYNAGSGMSPKFSFSGNDSLLLCSGVVLSRIDGLGARQNGYDWDWQPETIVQPTNRTSIYGDDESNKKALYSTLIGDRDISGASASSIHDGILNLPSNTEKAFESFRDLGWSEMVLEGQYYSGWSNWVCANKSFWLHNRQFGDYFTEELPKNTNLKVTRDAYLRSGQSRLYRRLLTTESGHWGWAPDWQYVGEEALPRKGDEIVVLFGCSTPLILRKAGETYKILGEAYVQGMMEGEAFQLVEKGDLAVHEFALS